MYDFLFGWFDVVFDELLFIVILCGLCMEGVEDVVQVFFDEGFCVVEVLLNLFDLFIIISCFVRWFGDWMVIGVGMVIDVGVVG